MNKQPLNGDQPATQEDLATLAGEMTTRFDSLESRMDSIESGLKTVLAVVNGIDQQLKEWKHIPAKVDRLDRRVFGSHG